MDPLGNPSETPRGPQTTLWEPAMDPLGPQGPPEAPEPHFGKQQWTFLETTQGPPEVPKPHFGTQL